MRSVVVTEKGNLDSIIVQETPIPEPAEGELLIQVKCAALNVSDLIFAYGQYNSTPPTPYALGIEGSGVIAKGDDSLIGKRVFLSLRGIYSEYVVVPKEAVFFLNDDITFEQGASLIVNPMTVYFMMEQIKAGNHRAVIINAAASALGKMLIQWCKSQSIPIICLVRRQELVDIVRQVGAEHVFNTSDQGWQTEARSLCESLGVTVGFDAIGGAECGTMIELTLQHGVVYNYGGLSGQPCSVSTMELITNFKRVEGFYLPGYLMTSTPEKKAEVSQDVQSKINGICKTVYSREVGLEGVGEAFKAYAEKKTDSKILVRVSTS